jgi:ABC-type multidrug transport system fused ATPase/permease subunit
MSLAIPFQQSDQQSDLQSERATTLRLVLPMAAIEVLAVAILICRPWLTGQLIDDAVHGAGFALALTSWGLALTWLGRALLLRARDRRLEQCSEHLQTRLRQKGITTLIATSGRDQRLADARLVAGLAPRLALDAWSAALRMGFGMTALALLHADLLLAVLPAAAICLLLVWCGRRWSLPAATVAADAAKQERSWWRTITGAAERWTPGGWLAWMSGEARDRARIRLDADLYAVRCTGWWQPVLAAAVTLGVVLVLLAGAPQVAAGTLSGGGLAAAVFLAILAVGPLMDLAGAADRWSTLAVAWQRWRRPVAEVPEVAADDGLAWSGLQVALPRGALTFPNRILTPGTQLLLTGPSGSGKSTLLRLLAGHQAPQAGELRGRGILLDHAVALPHWPVRAFIAATALAHGHAVDDQAIIRRAEELGLSPCLSPGWLERQAGHGSGTQLGQAVALLAASYARRPLLLDETFAGMPAGTMDRVASQLAVEGRTVVIASHRPEGLDGWQVLALE